MENVKKEFAARLRQALEAAGYEAKPAVLEREFNLRYWGKAVSLHGVRRWLLGETLPTHAKLLTLAEWLKVPPQELHFGVELEKQAKHHRARWDEGIGYQDREVFEAYLNLPVSQRKVVREVIVTFAQAHSAVLANQKSKI
jgi:transcriptional regulator with XRE-family HTH domain